MYEISELARVKYAEEIEIREMLQAIIRIAKETGYELEDEPTILSVKENKIYITLRKVQNTISDIIEV